MSTRSSVFSARRDLPSTTDTATCTIWILCTSAFFFFFIASGNFSVSHCIGGCSLGVILFFDKKKLEKIGIVLKSIETCIHSCYSNALNKGICFLIINLSAYQRCVSSRSLRTLNGNAHTLF